MGHGIHGIPAGAVLCSGDRAAAMSYFKKSLGIYRGLYGEQHPECVRTQRNIDRLRRIWNKQLKR